MSLLETHPAICPSCGASISLLIDGSAGEQVYIEDCEVCCHPMQVKVQAADGQIFSVEVEREG
ncbi:hypothetical protein BH24PSE2_BH24PSE2_24750 [soil metagenome]